MYSMQKQSKRDEVWFKSEEKKLTIPSKMSTQIVLTSKTFLRVVIECVFKCRASLYPSSFLSFRSSVTALAHFASAGRWILIWRSSYDTTHVQGVNWILCYFEYFKIYSGLWPLSFSPWCQCVYTMAGQTAVMRQNWQSSEKSQYFKEKHNI